MSRFITFSSIVVFFLLAGTTATAQFQGDVFFGAPSIAVISGQTGELEILTFVGTEPLGAVHLDITYSSQDLAVEALPGAATEFDGTLVSKRTEVGTSLVVMNSRSLDQPIGTVSLAVLRVTPLRSPGTTVPISITVRSMLRADSGPLTNVRGFAGEVIVVARPMSTPVVPTRPKQPGNVAVSN